MLSGIDVENLKYVVELGPGTGCFTQELYDVLPADCQVLVIELEADYVAQLQARFGQRFQVVQASAHELEALIAERGWPRVDLVLSGLPFVLPKPVQQTLWSTLMRLTSQGTVYRFFTYMPPIMKRYYRDFDLRLVRGVAANLPPMWIYSVN
jgi:phospholipid N-methyltransferase